MHEKTNGHLLSVNYMHVILTSFQSSLMRPVVHQTGINWTRNATHWQDRMTPRLGRRLDSGAWIMAFLKEISLPFMSQDCKVWCPYNLQMIIERIGRNTAGFGFCQAIDKNWQKPVYASFCRFKPAATGKNWPKVVYIV